MLQNKDAEIASIKQEPNANTEGGGGSGMRVKRERHDGTDARSGGKRRKSEGRKEVIVLDD